MVGRGRPLGADWLRNRLSRALQQVAATFVFACLLARLNFFLNHNLGAKRTRSQSNADSIRRARPVRGDLHKLIVDIRASSHCVLGTVNSWVVDDFIGVDLFDIRFVRSGYN